MSDKAVNGPGLAVIGKKLKSLETRRGQLQPLISKVTCERDNLIREEAMVLGAIQVCREMLVELQKVKDIDPPGDPN